jgi:hypothetical protein
LHPGRAEDPVGRRNRASPARDCTTCRLFVDDPRALEAELPGLCILSSAQGDSRGRAGLCRARGTFQDPEPPCADFVARAGQEGHADTTVTDE